MGVGGGRERERASERETDREKDRDRERKRQRKSSFLIQLRAIPFFISHQRYLYVLTVRIPLRVSDFHHQLSVRGLFNVHSRAVLEVSLMSTAALSLKD